MEERHELQLSAACASTAALQRQQAALSAELKEFKDHASGLLTALQSQARYSNLHSRIWE